MGRDGPPRDDPARAVRLQDVFHQPYFRVYSNNDVVGTELAGAIKNIIAIAAGIADEFGFGDNATAVLMAYNPGNEGGQAVADVLFGDFNPCGKLPFTYPRSANGLMTYDHKAFENERFDNAGIRPQFEFGECLSYTTFSYKDLRLDRKTIGAGDQLSVSATVTNSGRRAGKEIVQLYVSDLVASLSPPGKRLKRFAKIYLEPGQSRTLTFRLRPDDLSFIAANNKPVVEPGEFEVMVAGLKERFQFK